MIDQREIDLLRSLLRSSEGTPLTDLKDQISGDAAVLQAVIEGLERDGYRFDKTGQSIRLLSEPDAVRSQSIAARLTTETIGREIYVFRETTSTNDLARRAGIGKAVEGVLLRSSLPVDQWPALVQMGALASVEAAEQWADAPVGIKPPNDLVLAGGKLAGFLLETSNAWNFQVLGIGINVRSAPQIAGYPTSALDALSKRSVPLAELAAEILNRFEEWYLRRPIESMASAFEARVKRTVASIGCE